MGKVRTSAALLIFMFLAASTCMFICAPVALAGATARQQEVRAPAQQPGGARTQTVVTQQQQRAQQTASQLLQYLAQQATPSNTDNDALQQQITAQAPLLSRLGTSMESLYSALVAGAKLPFSSALDCMVYAARHMPGEVTAGTPPGLGQPPTMEVQRNADDSSSDILVLRRRIQQLWLQIDQQQHHIQDQARHIRASQEALAHAHQKLSLHIAGMSTSLEGMRSTFGLNVQPTAARSAVDNAPEAFSLSLERISGPSLLDSADIVTISRISVQRPGSAAGAPNGKSAAKCCQAGVALLPSITS
jgi:hypothetical protein